MIRMTNKKVLVLTIHRTFISTSPIYFFFSMTITLLVVKLKTFMIQIEKQAAHTRLGFPLDFKKIGGPSDAKFSLVSIPPF